MILNPKRPKPLTLLSMIRGRRAQIKMVSRDFFFVTCGALILSLNFFVFMEPTNIAPGGITGIALLINEFTGWSNSIMLMIMRFVALGVGFFFLGGFYYLPRALYLTVIISVMMIIMESMSISWTMTEDLLLNTIFGGFVGGLGMGLVLLGGATATGTATFSRILQLKTGIPTSYSFVVIDGGILVFQGLVFGWDKALYGLIMLVIWGMGTDYMLEGPSVIRTLFIITDRPEETASALFDKLGVGVTAWSATGMFTHSHQTTLFCTVNRADVNSVKDIVTQVDPGAFFVIGQGHQASGGVIKGAAAVSPVKVQSSPGKTE